PAGAGRLRRGGGRRGPGRADRAADPGQPGGCARAQALLAAVQRHAAAFAVRGTGLQGRNAVDGHHPRNHGALLSRGGGGGAGGGGRAALRADRRSYAALRLRARAVSAGRDGRTNRANLPAVHPVRSVLPAATAL
ncbi:MAG: hypothetical protein AVDCRST_MAG89-624, partial [uncultured Gemmatimonadetes bacterium]